MSIQALNWALSQDQITNSATRFVLLVLCNYANEDRQCYPSRETIAKKTSLSVRTVQDHLNWLVEHKYITKDIRRFDGKQTSNLYTIIGVQSAKSALSPTSQGADNCQSQGATSAHYPKESYTKANKNTLAIAQDASEDSIQDTDHVIASSSPEKEKSSAPPAVLAVREVCKRFPPKPIWHVIQDAIGDTPDIDRLQKTYEGWVLNGFKPTNYAWATDWYPKGITSKQEAYQTEIKKTEPSYNYVRNQPTQREAIAAEQEMLAKLYESTTRS